MNLLGTLHFTLKQYKEALSLFLPCLAKRTLTLGKTHIDTLRSINNLALLYKSVGMLEEAERYYLESLEGTRSLYGDNHRDTHPYLSE